VIGCEDCLQNDLGCFGWSVKLYTYSNPGMDGKEREDWRYVPCVLVTVVNEFECQHSWCTHSVRCLLYIMSLCYYMWMV